MLKIAPSSLLFVQHVPSIEIKSRGAPYPRHLTKRSYVGQIKWAMEEGSTIRIGYHRGSKLLTDRLEVRALETQMLHCQRNETHSGKGGHPTAGPLELGEYFDLSINRSVKSDHLAWLFKHELSRQKQ